MNIVETYYNSCTHASGNHSDTLEVGYESTEFVKIYVRQQTILSYSFQLKINIYFADIYPII